MSGCREEISVVVHLTIVNWQKFRSSKEDPCTSTTYEVWRIVSVDEKHPKLPGAGTSSNHKIPFSKTSSTDRWQSHMGWCQTSKPSKPPRTTALEMMKTTNFQKLPRTYLLLAHSRHPCRDPSEPGEDLQSSSPGRSRHSKIIQEDRSKVKLVFFNTKKNGFKSKIHGILGKENSSLHGFFVDVFFWSAMIETLRPWPISGVTRTTWVLPWESLTTQKLINSNTKYDTIINHSTVYTYIIYI